VAVELGLGLELPVMVLVDLVLVLVLVLLEPVLELGVLPPLVVEEATLVDAPALRVTTPTSSRSSSSKSMSNSRCGDVTPPNTTKADTAGVDQLHGRGCTMMFRNPLLLETLAVADVVDSRRVEATEDQLRRRPTQPRLLQLTPLPDPRMLESPVRIIVAAVEVGSAAFTHMLGNETLKLLA
jgi:hypothetical protein